MIRQQIVEHARKYIGVPWVHQGRNKHGLDCAGLLSIVATDIGVVIMDTTHYSRFYSPSVLMKKFYENGCKEIPLNLLVAGDIIVVKIGRAPMHVGILSKKNGVDHIIHSLADSSFVREEPIDFLMRRTFHTGFSFPGV